MAEMPEIVVNVVAAEGSRLVLSSGDTLVVTYPGRLLIEQMEYLKACVKRSIPEGVNVLVLDGGMTVAAISAKA